MTRLNAGEVIWLPNAFLRGASWSKTNGEFLGVLRQLKDLIPYVYSDEGSFYIVDSDITRSDVLKQLSNGVMGYIEPDAQELLKEYLKVRKSIPPQASFGNFTHNILYESENGHKVMKHSWNCINWDCSCMDSKQSSSFDKILEEFMHTNSLAIHSLINYMIENNIEMSVSHNSPGKKLKNVIYIDYIFVYKREDTSSIIQILFREKHRGELGLSKIVTYSVYSG